MRLFLLICLGLLSAVTSGEEPAPRKIVLIAGKKSHGPGAHDYERTMRLFKVMLDNSNVADHVRVEVHENGWPEDEKTLDDADTIVFYSDGRDGNLYSDVPFVIGERMQVLQKQMDRGCGMMTIHFSTFVDDNQGEKVLDWVGGYFDWQDDKGERNWFSKISQVETLELAARDHPISQGVPRMLQIRDEVYWKLRFLPDDKRLTPVWKALDVKDDAKPPHYDTVGWAIERKDGGRGFGTSVGHAYRLWQDEGIRRLFLNAVVWTAKADIPAGGVQARFYNDDQVKLALSDVQGKQRAIVQSPPRVLLLSGNKAHAWHNVEKSTPRVQAALEAGKIEVQTSTDVEDFAKLDLSNFDCIVLNNYANWQDPRPLGERAKDAFLKFLHRGGGLVVVHFANGAFHYSLPMAGESDWPEYRKIVRRVWDHKGEGDQKSGHDAFGKFKVNVVGEHPIVGGLKPFEVTDELYFNQAGSEPIERMLTARSQVTKRDEPLAFAYEYEQARVCQTLLGHSEQTYDSYEPREMLRRAVYWTSRRKVPTLSEEEEQKAIDSGGEAISFSLVEGKRGKALDARKSGVLLKPKAYAGELPLTIDCWSKLDSKEGFNILVASEEKASATHWELYSYAGSGVASVYMPGRGGEFKSDINICDGQWHQVGCSIEPDRVRIFVDGKPVLDKKLDKKPEQPPGDSRSALAVGIGRLVEGSLGCTGLIDDVRIKRGEDSLLQVTFDDEAELRKLLLAAARNIPKPAVSKTKADHWGIEGVGFKWKEEDSRDDRWKDAEIGPFLASSLPLGSAAGTVAKGLSIRLGDKQEATVCYDTANMKLRAAWTGGFLKFTPVRYGLIMPPLIDGEPAFIAAESPGWEAKEIKYRGLRVMNERTVLEYEVDGVKVSESPWIDTNAGQTVFTRQIEIQKAKHPLLLRVAAKLAESDIVELQTLAGHQIGVLKSGGQIIAFGTGNPDAKFRIVDGRELQLVVPADVGALVVPLRFASIKENSIDGFAEQAATSKTIPLELIVRQRHKQWTEEITTQGVRAKDDAPYVIDTLTLPFDNPYKALWFTSGHDAIDANTMAVCTVHGDVWTAKYDDSLANIRWQRFANGLFQPLGLVAKEDGIYVLGRDQITRLRDDNKDGEADYYECFNHQFPTSPGGHDYTSSLETDDAGNFYFLTAQQGIWRLSSDGKQLENLAGGLRNPNGLGVGYPTLARRASEAPIITTAPQEGNWTPASYIAEARPGDWFGYPGPKITPERPLGWTQPLCFIPRRRDNSSGGQIWASSDRWGPLAGQLLHFSYGQCRMMLVLREVIDGQPQGGTVDLPQLFESGAMRGRFNPYDGQLYVSGLRGWTTAATQDGCLQRVRYTGQPVHLPIKWRTLQNGIAITFTEPLDRASAEDPGNYHLEQWNYRYAESYGSPDFKVSDSKQEGHDEVRVASATLLADGKTVFLELPEIKPVHQLTIGYALKSGDGSEHRHTIAYTIHKLGADKLDESLINRKAVAGRLSDEEVALLKPGLIARFEQNRKRDTRVSRLAALYVGEKQAPSLLLSPGEFSATLQGYLKVDLPGKYRLRFEGVGTAEVLINGQLIGRAQSPLSQAVMNATLHSGYNALQIKYQSEGIGQLRLLWESDELTAGPIPPTTLFHRSDDAELVAGQRLRQGQALAQKYHCAQCHSDLFQEDRKVGARGPSLLSAGEDYRAEWLAARLLEPHRYSSVLTAPCGFHSKVENQGQTAADIVAYLSTLRPDGKNDAGLEVRVPESTRELASKGAALWEDLNCLACHRFSPPTEKDEFNRASLHFAAAKFTPEGLMRFLSSPSHPGHFKLDSDEAQSLFTHLLNAATGKVMKLPDLEKGSAERGRQHVFASGCADCHQVESKAAFRTHNYDVAQLDRGCLAIEEAKRDAAPRLPLNGDEKALIAAYLKTTPKISSARSPAEDSQQLMTELRCNACHNRDGITAQRMSILAEESETGLTPELLPDLTWTGEKLTSAAIQAVLAGQQRARPWLKSRMPSFHPHTEILARGLAAEHGFAVDEGPTKSDLALAKIGEELTHKENLDCRQCHAIGALEPTGDDKTKLAPGINFALIRERLRPAYYQRFVLDPPRWEVNTRMPKLAADGKTTKVTKHFDGDAAKQIEAIWHYMLSLERQPAAAGKAD